MKFKRRHEWRTDVSPVTASGLVDRAVGYAGYDASGAVETLRAEVQCLTEIVGLLVARLPEEDLLEVAEALHFERAASTTQHADGQADQH